MVRWTTRILIVIAMVFGGYVMSTLGYKVAERVVGSDILVSDAHAQSAKTRLTDPVLAERFNEISDKLVCQCGCNMILRVCSHYNCQSATPMRAQIEEQLTAGMTNEAIMAGFVEEVGIKVMSSPPAEGLNLAAWIMPHLWHENKQPKEPAHVIPSDARPLPGATSYKSNGQTGHHTRKPMTTQR